MGTLSCHSNQSSYLTGKKHNFCRGYCPKHVCQVSASSPLWFLRRRFLNIFTKNLPFLPHRQPIKFTDLDKSRIKRRGLLNKHSVKKNPDFPNETEKIVNFLTSHYKSMGTISCHSNQSSYPTGIKKHNFCRGYCPKHVCQVSASSPLWFLRRRFLNIFTKIDPFCRADNQSNSPIRTKVV